MPIIAICGIIAAVIFSAGAGVGSYLTGNSYKSEMLHTEQEKVKDLNDAQSLLNAASHKNAELAAQNLRLSNEVANHAAKATQKIYAADAALRRDTDGLRIPATACRAVTVPAATDSPAVDNGIGRPDWLRLPDRVETDLYDYALKANRARVKRDECREWAIGLQEQGQPLSNP